MYYILYLCILGNSVNTGALSKQSLQCVTLYKERKYITNRKSTLWNVLRIYFTNLVKIHKLSYGDFEVDLFANQNTIFNVCYWFLGRYFDEHINNKVHNLSLKPLQFATTIKTFLQLFVKIFVFYDLKNFENDFRFILI